VLRLNRKTDCGTDSSVLRICCEQFQEVTVRDTSTKFLGARKDMREKFSMTRRKETQKLFLSSSELINATELVQKIASDTCRKMGSLGCRAASGFSRAGEARRESRGSREFWTRRRRVRIFGSQETVANEIVQALLTSRTEGDEEVESADLAGPVRSMQLRRFDRQSVCRVVCGNGKNGSTPVFSGLAQGLREERGPRSGRGSSPSILRPALQFPFAIHN
jgi:hypothetical protein